jgi:cytochrome c-type biogenesis protein
VGGLLTDNREVISAVGGVVVIVLGLYQLGVLRRPDVLERERRLPLSLDRLAMSPWVALLMGFAFSFAWTPCVGPTLASVLLMAATESTQALGFLLIAVYSLGFCIPFLLVALMADRALGLLKAHPSAMRRAVQVGGALLVVMGALMVTGGMSSLSSIAASLGGATNQGEVTSVQDVSSPDAASQPTTTTGKDFTLSDQNGTTHALSDYRGRVVVLNFWATWCTYCKQEMPDIQALYDERGANAGDVVVLGVANPKDDSHPRNGDVSADEVGAFLSANGYTYPVLMDTTGDVLSAYGVTAFPTTVIIGKDGSVQMTLRGAVSSAVIEGQVSQALSR